MFLLVFCILSEFGRCFCWFLCFFLSLEGVVVGVRGGC